MRLDSLLHLAVASAFIGLASACLFSLLTYPAVRRLAATGRHLPARFWFCVGVAPLVVGISFLAFSIASGWLSFGGWLADHCPLHPGHPHLCLAHIAESPPGGLIFWLALSSGVGWIGFQSSRSYFLGRKLMVTLSATSRPNGEYHLLPSRIAAAFTAGLLRPRVYLTTQAAHMLQPEERKAVLIHERAHVLRRDPLRSMILALSEKCFPGMKGIRRRWMLAVETECDRAAVREGFPEALVARTILKLKRANQGRLAQAAVIHYAGSDADALRSRLELLLNGPVKDSRIGGVWILLPVFWLLSVLFFPQVHHAMETLLGWLG